MAKVTLTKLLKAKPSSAEGSQLPNAPLTEVVFELHWKLQGDEATPQPFKIDPGYYVFIDKFTRAAARLGFGHSQQMSQTPMVLSSGIERRFYRSKDQPFPVLQTGHGIFAVNDSASYKWESYRKLCLEAVEELFNSYPELTGFTVEPNHLELRYLDSFNAHPTATQDLATFLEKDMTIKIDVPSFVPEYLGRLDSGTIALKYPVKSLKDTIFQVSIGNALINKANCINMQSSVLTQSSSLEVPKSKQARITYVEHWLNKAHEITSPFFREVVKPHLMEKFKGTPNA